MTSVGAFAYPVYPKVFTNSSSVFLFGSVEKYNRNFSHQ